MNKIKESLEANIDEILGNIPSELHAEAKKQIESAEAQAILSSEEEVEAIKQAIRDNPDVDTDSVLNEFEKNPSGHKSAPLPTGDEQLKNVKQELPAEFHKDLDEHGMGGVK